MALAAGHLTPFVAEDLNSSYNDGDAVASVSLGGETATQATSGQRAVFRENRKNGYGSLQFTAANQHNYNFGDKFDLLDKSGYFFLVAKITSGGIVNKSYAGNPFDRYGLFKESPTSAFTGVYQNTSEHHAVSSSSYAADTEFYLYEAHFCRTSGKVRIYRDTVLIAESTFTPDTANSHDSPNNFYIGRYADNGVFDLFGTFEVCEIVPYLVSTELSSAQLTQNRDHLGAKYALAYYTPPAGQPVTANFSSSATGGDGGDKLGSINSGSSLTITDGSGAGNGTAKTYVYKVDGAPVSTDPSPVISGLAAGLRTIRQEITQSGSTVSKEKTVFVGVIAGNASIQNGNANWYNDQTNIANPVFTKLSGSGTISSQGLVTAPNAGNGNSSITIKATDPLDATKFATKTITFSDAADTTDPTGSINSPTAAQILRGTHLFKIAAQDNVAVQSVQLKINGALVGAPVTTRTNGYFEVSYNTALLSNAANHQASAVVIDTANRSIETAAVTFQVDNLAPGGSITAPSAGQVLTGGFEFVAQASDLHSGVKNVKFFIDAVQENTDSLSPFTCSKNTALLSNGSHNVYALVEDNAGNTYQTPTVTFTVNNAVVEPPPPAEGVPAVLLANFEELKLSQIFAISQLELDMPLLFANFGAGYGAGALSAPASGLRGWAIEAGLLPDMDEFSVDYELNGGAENDTRFQYFWEFFRRHVALGNKPFYFRDPRTGRFFLASFVEPRLSFSALTAKLYQGGVMIVQRRAKVSGINFRADDASVIDA